MTAPVDRRPPTGGISDEEYRLARHAQILRAQAAAKTEHGEEWDAFFGRGRLVGVIDRPERPLTWRQVIGERRAAAAAEQQAQQEWAAGRTMLVELRGELLMDGAEEDPLARYFGAAQAQEECEQAGRQAGELRKRALRDLYQREGSLAKVAAMVGLSRAQVHKLIK